MAPRRKPRAPPHPDACRTFRSPLLSGSACAVCGFLSHQHADPNAPGYEAPPPPTPLTSDTATTPHRSAHSRGTHRSHNAEAEEEMTSRSHSLRAGPGPRDVPGRTATLRGQSQPLRGASKTSSNSTRDTDALTVTSRADGAGGVTLTIRGGAFGRSGGSGSSSDGGGDQAGGSGRHGSASSRPKRVATPLRTHRDQHHGAHQSANAAALSLEREAALVRRAGDVAARRGDLDEAEARYLEAASLIAAGRDTPARSRAHSPRQRHPPADDESVDGSDEGRNGDGSSVEGVEVGEYDLELSQQLSRTLLTPRDLHIRDDLLQADRSMLDALGWLQPRRDVVLTLFRRFCNSPHMLYEDFMQLCASRGVGVNPACLFRAFDRRQHSTWLSDSDFLMGVAALAPATPHSGVWRQARLSCIFRYYSRTGRSLTREEVAALVIDALPPSAATGQHRRRERPPTTRRGRTAVAWAHDTADEKDKEEERNPAAYVQRIMQNKAVLSKSAMEAAAVAGHLPPLDKVLRIAFI